MPGPLAVALVAVFAATPAPADTRLGEACDLAAVGAEDRADFLRFDAALRAALERQDAAATARLVQFPLRLNGAGGGHASLDDSAALEKRFGEAFPPAVRKAVIEQKSADLFCKSDGVMYGQGELWANLVGAGSSQTFRVTAINLPTGVEPKSEADASHADLACSTDKFHIVIDGGDAPRYRAWNQPHAPPDPPAMALSGRRGGEGTGPCFHRIWRFRNSNVEYVLSEPGCTEDSVPERAKARLDIRIGNRPPRSAWCY